MSGEPEKHGQPIFDANDSEVQKMLARIKASAANSEDHHRRERAENLARRIEGVKEERRPAEG